MKNIFRVMQGYRSMIYLKHGFLTFWLYIILNVLIKTSFFDRQYKSSIYLNVNNICIYIACQRRKLIFMCLYICVYTKYIFKTQMYMSLIRGETEIQQKNNLKVGGTGAGSLILSPFVLGQIILAKLSQVCSSCLLPPATTWQNYVLQKYLIHYSKLPGMITCFK